MHITITELGPDDRPVVAEVLAGLSERSRYERFHAHVPVVGRELLDRLCDIDGHDHVAAAAWVGRGPLRRKRPVGTIRLVRSEPQLAELAIEVVDEFQGRGIGRQLMSWARRAADERGMATVAADVLVENQAMRRLFTSTFPGATARADGHVVSFEWRGGRGPTVLESADLLGLGAA